MMQASERWVENRPTRGARSLRLEELWRHRELVAFLALRDVKARYKQAVFGVGWAIVQPVVTVAMFAVVFHRLAAVPSEGLPYGLFALSGVAVWTYFSSSVNGATGSLVHNSALVTKIYFPRLAAPVAALGHGLITLAISFVLLAALMLYHGTSLHLGVVAVPVLLVLLLAAALGAGLLLATLNVRYRDVHHVFGFLMQAWLFATPVGYPSSLVPTEWRWLYYLNPMAGVADGFRWSMFGSPELRPEMVMSVLSAVALLVVGLWYFQRMERQFADVI